MKLTVLRKMEYEGTNIYIMQFDYTFQYLYVWGNEIYQDRIESLPSWWKRVLWRFNIIKSKYTEDQISECEQIVLSGAMRSIDTIKEQSQKKKKKKVNGSSRKN